MLFPVDQHSLYLAEQVYSHVLQQHVSGYQVPAKINLKKLINFWLWCVICYNRPCILKIQFLSNCTSSMLVNQIIIIAIVQVKLSYVFTCILQMLYLLLQVFWALCGVFMINFYGLVLSFFFVFFDYNILWGNETANK